MSRPAVLMLTRLLPDPDRLADMGIRSVIAIVFAIAIQRAVFLLVGRFERLVVRHGHGAAAAQSRAQTLGQTLRGLITALVTIGAGIYLLGLMGWNVAPLLAGAGILGVALGFGAQTLVRDLIAGLFILAENQFSVGDVIEFDGRPAAVEALSARSTVLRDFNGYMRFVPNGELRTVTNRSRGWTRLAVDVPVASDQSLEKALEVCRRVVNAMNSDPGWQPRLLDPVELWGVESLGPAEALIRIVVRALPGDAAPEAARELRLKVHRALMDSGVRTALSREIAVTQLPGGRSGERTARGGEGA